MSRFVKVSSCYDNVFSSLDNTNNNVYYLDRLQTAAKSVTVFMTWVSCVGVTMESGGAVMTGVGLTCGGRSGCYTMVYNAKKKIIFAIDKNDKNYVCQVSI